MGTKFTATAAAETFTNPSHTVDLYYGGGTVAYEGDGGGVVINVAFGDGYADASEPYNGFVEGYVGNEPDNQIFSIIGSHGEGDYYFEVFADNSVDYSFSNAPVFIDLTRTTQQGGYAQGDTLVDVFEVTGSSFDDVIRGSNTSDYPLNSQVIVVNGKNTQSLVFFTINKPGENVLNGGNGNDVLEGRGGADVMNGGLGFDFASYKSSPAGVYVRVNDPSTGSFTANYGDASGDTLSSIEGLVGSRFADTLIGSSNDNVLAGGLGSDYISGGNGTDTVDYSRDHFFDPGDTADRVVVRLGLSGASGTGQEFDAVVDLHTLTVSYNLVSTDTLVSIENVTGTSNPDEIFGNEQANVLDGRGGNDLLDGGFGNDTLIGGSGNDTASFASHNSVTGETGFIALGVNGATGVGRYSNAATNQLLETDVLFGIENVTGSSLDELIVGNEQNNILDGGFGNDRLVGGDGSDTASYISHDGGTTLLGERDTISLGLNGANGSYARTGYVSTFGLFQFRTVESDVLVGIENVIGSNHAETINGNEQNNVLEGRGGNDVINGGAGDDTYVFNGSGLGTDTLFDSGGADRIVTDATAFKMAHVGNDLQITLPTGSFTIRNHFAGNPIETFVDGKGHTLVLATGLIGAAKAGVISGDNTSEYMDGGGGDDYLFGNGGKDHMLGSAGNDYLDGGKGNDILDGGSGDDQLFGGKGHDTFVFAPVEPDGLPPGNDTILDFVHGQDRIDLTAFDITAKQLDQLLGGLGESSHHHGGIFNSVGYLDFGRDHHQNDFGKFGSCGPANKDPGPITIETVGNDTVLSFDGGSIDIVGVQNLHANDFIV